MRPFTAGLVLALLARWTPISYAQTALPPPTGASSPPAVAAPSATPQWNPYLLRCEGAPPLDDPAAAECDGHCFALSAPRKVAGAVAPGAVVELGLWDRSLAPTTGHAAARVIAPDGGTTSAVRDGYRPTWISLHYPDDFAGAGGTAPGVSTVVWETRGLVVCDGFTVEAS